MPSTAVLTRAEAVADELRRMIRTGELAGGTWLRQMHIAELFGVSSTPVREAFTALAREGLVRQDAHRGVIVFTPSLADLQENYAIRMALEPLATEMAAQRISTEQLDELDGLLEQMGEVRADSMLHGQVLNPQFHATIYGAAKMPRLAKIIESLRDASSAYTVLLLIDSHLPESYLTAVTKEHEEIVAALHARSPKRAAKAMRAHLAHNLEQMTTAIGVRAVKER